MAWEFRKNRRYYYDAQRVGGRVVKTYLGKGDLVEQAIKLARADKLMRWLDRLDAEDRLEAVRLRERERQVFFDQINIVINESLLKVGYHRHRGQWRRYRRPVMNTLIPANATILSEWDDDKIPPLTSQLSKRDQKKLEKGDHSVLPAVRKALRANPERARRWGDLASHAMRRMLDTVGWSNLRDKEAVKMRVSEIRSALAGPNPNPIEELLAERAAICWLDVYLADQAVASFAPDYNNKRSAAFHDQRRSRADRRFLDALKTLAVVRRMKLPDLLAVVQVQNTR